METLSEIKDYVEKHGLHKTFCVLRMKSYETKASLLHENHSKIVSAIDRKRKQISVDDSWRALKHLIYGWPNNPTCKICDDPVRLYMNKFSTYCSQKCMLEDEEFKKSRWEKIESTMTKRYGSLAGMLEKTSNKRAKTMRARHGVDYYVEHSSFKKKSQKTSKKTYGTRHPMQNQEVFERQQIACMKRKTLKIGGTTFVNLQGYEPNAIRYLISEGLSPKVIKAHPSFDETLTWIDEEGVKHSYFPDLLVNKRHIIEVKSSYTFNGTPEMIYRNKKKRQACLERGFKFTFLVFSSDRSQRLLKRVTKG